jgi:hypothetical protein
MQSLILDCFVLWRKNACAADAYDARVGMSNAQPTRHSG